MNNINKDILAALYEITALSVSNVLIAGVDIEVKYDDNDQILDIIKKHSIIKEDVGKSTLRINLRQFSFPVFFNKKDFLSNVSLKLESTDIGILNYEEAGFLFYDNSINKSSGSSGVQSDNYFVQNTFAYLRIKNIIASDKIADYLSDASREIVIVSPTKGKLIIQYPSIIDEFDPNQNIRDYEDILIEKLVSKEFNKFFKNELYEFLSSIDKQERLKFLILNLQTIIEASERNYDIYLSSFSFDQLRDEYDKRKQKYFDELRGIINKISGYSIGLPISISAASFAAYKTIDSLPTYVLIISSFIVFSLYFIFMIRHNRDDIQEIKTDYKTDFEQLFKKDFFIRNVSEKESFIQLEKLLNHRLHNLLIKINFLFTIVILLNTSLIVVLLIQIKFSFLKTFLISTVLVILFFLLYLYKPRSDEK